MSTNTPNIGLLKKDPTTEGTDTFNIQTMLNENWDKIDAVTGPASTTQKGVVKVGAGLNVDANGVVSVPAVDVPVTSVNSKTGDVSLSAADVGAAAQTDFAAHLADYANPHQVTADQAGAIAKSLLTAAGDIIYASAAQTPARLAKGTAGQVLKMNSGAIAPEWGNSSDWELIGTLSPSAWEALFSNIPTDYKQLRLYGVMGSSNNATYTTNTVTITFNDDDTVSPGNVYLTCKGTTLVAAANLPSSTTGLYAPYTTDTNKFEFILDIDNTYTQLGYPATFTLLIRGYNGSSWFAGIPLFGHYKLNEAITRLRLYGNVGTLVGTTLKLYGKR